MIVKKGKSFYFGNKRYKPGQEVPDRVAKLFPDCCEEKKMPKEVVKNESPGTGGKRSGGKPGG